MSNFNNNVYQSLVTDLIGDTFYKDTSVSGRISFVRKYAEVVIRKILDIDSNKAVTLGAKNIQNRIKNLPNHEFLEAAVETVRSKGNQSTHTQLSGGSNMAKKNVFIGHRWDYKEDYERISGVLDRSKYDVSERSVESSNPLVGTKKEVTEAIKGKIDSASVILALARPAAVTVGSMGRKEINYAISRGRK